MSEYLKGSHFFLNQETVCENEGRPNCSVNFPVPILYHGFLKSIEFPDDLTCCSSQDCIRFLETNNVLCMGPAARGTVCRPMSVHLQVCKHKVTKLGTVGLSSHTTVPSTVAQKQAPVFCNNELCSYCAYGNDHN
jgi:hypothetical protein